MPVPFFYIYKFIEKESGITLDEDTSRHVVQVLRMQAGERINLTDGKGSLIQTSIIDAHKKHCTVKTESVSRTELPTRHIAIAISILKNTSRLEWFLEKATEIGVNEIIPLIASRTEKEKFRHDRLQGILISAMLQSQQTWLPMLHQPIDYRLLFKQEEVNANTNKFIAHCEDSVKVDLAEFPSFDPSSIILIGPEGDFTPEEIELAFQHGFQAVSLGRTRLRTETAALVAR